MQLFRYLWFTSKPHPHLLLCIRPLVINEKCVSVLVCTDVSEWRCCAHARVCVPERVMSICQLHRQARGPLYVCAPLVKEVFIIVPRTAKCFLVTRLLTTPPRVCESLQECVSARAHLMCNGGASQWKLWAHRVLLQAVWVAKVNLLPARHLCVRVCFSLSLPLHCRLHFAGRLLPTILRWHAFVFLLGGL